MKQRQIRRRQSRGPVNWQISAGLIILTLVLLGLIQLSRAGAVRSEPDWPTTQRQTLAAPASAPTTAIRLDPTAGTHAPETTAWAKHAASGYLILVNWNHPLESDHRPTGLVLQGSLFGDDLVTCNKEGSINAVAGEALRAMLLAARQAGLPRYILTSAYRSVSYQESMFQKKLAEDPDYGKDPYTNPVKVLPGLCSEHTTGLAVDLLSETYRDANAGYAESEAGRWLQENAHRFGFILRYPRHKEHITGVIFEPWHYRYVGIIAATELFETGLCLEEYVG